MGRLCAVLSPVYVSFPHSDHLLTGANSMTSPPFLAYNDEYHVCGLMEPKTQIGF